MAGVGESGDGGIVEPKMGSESIIKSEGRWRSES